MINRIRRKSTIKPPIQPKMNATVVLAELSRLADQDSNSVVRWITAADNATARTLYDSAAAATSWVTYDLAPGSL